MNRRRLRNRIRQTGPRRFHPRNTRRRHERALARLQMRFRGVHEPEVRLDVVEEAAVPVRVEHALFEVGEVGHAGPARVGDYDVQAAEGREGVGD